MNLGWRAWLLAALLIGVLPVPTGAQVFLGSRPHPEFGIGPLASSSSIARIRPAEPFSVVESARYVPCTLVHVTLLLQEPPLHPGGLSVAFRSMRIGPSGASALIAK